MDSELVFSVATMKACTGRATSDFTYFQYFVSVCDERIRSGAERLQDLAAGAQAYDGNSESMARAAVAEVRRGLHTLQACEDWFKGKPDIARRFVQARQSVADVGTAAEADFALVLQFFGRT